MNRVMLIDNVITLCVKGLAITADYRQNQKTLKRRMVPRPGRIERTPACFRSIREAILELDASLLKRRRIQWCLELLATKRERGQCKYSPSYTALTHALGAVQHLLMQERPRFQQIEEEKVGIERFWQQDEAAA